VGASYLLDGLLLTGFAITGAAHWATPVAFLILGGLGTLAFWLILRRPQAERYRDQYLTRWQFAYAATVQVVGIYMEPGLAAFFLGVLFIIFAVATLRLSLREMLVLWLLVGVAIIPAFRTGAVFSLMRDFSREAALVAAVSYMLITLRCILIGYLGYRLRLSYYGRSREVGAANRQLEQWVLERTAELTHANRDLIQVNRELQAYAYAMVHEFRGPLRAINGYSALLGKEYAGKPLDADGEVLIERTRAASNRMAELVDSLSHLATVSRTVARPRALDLVPLATHIVQAFQRRDPARAVEWAHPPELMVDADPELMRSALRVLIDNAWKFTARMPGARIELGVEETAGVREIFVRDNGAGFDRAYADKLFGIFQRLHSESEFEGNGVGLALLERIVSLHGGQVRAEGVPGEGATFRFTLPGVRTASRAA
jgi:signal transduction histidine kinase